VCPSGAQITATPLVFQPAPSHSLPLCFRRLVVMVTVISEHEWHMSDTHGTNSGARALYRRPLVEYLTMLMMSKLY
jgi:hypothetical protein